MKKKTPFIIGGAIIVALIALAVWYFAFQTACTPIGKLLENPAEFENKIITIRGEVADRMALLAVKYYILKDNTGEIKVVTKRALPAKGIKLSVKGKVKAIFAIGSEQEIVFIEEK